jgi:hypothetical protein
VSDTGWSRLWLRRLGLGLRLIRECGNTFVALRTDFGLGASIFVFNGDGQTNSNDFAEFRKRFGIKVP